MKTVERENLQQRQEKISIFEAGNIWSKLSARYDVTEETKILLNFVKDKDFRVVIKIGIQVLEQQIKELEDLAQHYGLPVPKRPAVHTVSTINVETITDRFVFKCIFDGMQSFLPVHMVAFQKSGTFRIRKKFKEFLIKEMELYDKMSEYGKLKGWISIPPKYRI